MYTREEALGLLKEHTSSESLIKHAYAVEAAMRGYAKKYDEDVELWGLTGLLHDLDYEKHPDEHPMIGVRILKEADYPMELVDAVEGHGKPDALRETQLAKALFAVDELASFIVAYVLVRPDKSFEGIKTKSIKKKLKDKAFARGVDRELVKLGAEQLGVDLTDHINLISDALYQWEEELNTHGESLV
ncbi:HD domain-containing protein [Vallitalea okinawensis]|uniref:HD domain-containing protein n=1 Tax=Vallitalea okinawensis TaxID=2078660 RepID=UPI000CFD5062|nr:HD domain-containing protein [Vallitalea okinawensis]